MLEYGLLTAFSAGVLSFLSPCVLPLAPPYLAYMAGVSLSEMSGEDAEVDDGVARKVLISSLFFVLGLGTVFVAAGATATAFGRMLAQQQVLFGQIAGVVIVVMGLHFLGVIRIPFLYREARFDAGAAAGSFAGAYVMGLAFAFGWTPCIGPILGAILGLAAQETTLSKGMIMLAVYTVGLGVPFILAAAFVRPFLRFMRGFRRHLQKVEWAMGGLLIIVGVAMITGDFSRAAFWLLETFPGLAELG